jgi:hypothetical protein
VIAPDELAALAETKKALEAEAPPGAAPDPVEQAMQAKSGGANKSAGTGDSETHDNKKSKKSKKN